MDADIDRRVEVLEGSEAQHKTIQRISDLRALPHYVLLGEPGIGKTSTFAKEAEFDSAPVLKVRALLTGKTVDPEKTLFLDGLDEYRIDGEAADKVQRLAQALEDSQATRWRLACRSEDWRKDADVEPIRTAAGGAEIVVVQLLPLEHDEAEAILDSLGEPNPHEFLSKAHAFSASAFCESPLSLTLLQKTVASEGGTWPRTRYELFDASIRRLAFERNSEYKYARRSSPADIVKAAGTAFLLMLACGARGFWRSNDEAPGSGDVRAFLSAHDLSLSVPLFSDMLDTSLFRGEGEAFEPMHRTIAEFLAAEALAHAISGGLNVAALPMSRALALVAGFDGRAPTELRGLYAWLAVHLVKLGDVDGARRLVDADPVTVLGYGDAGSLGTPARQAILANLGIDDPYFRASEVGVTYIGSLAGEDLAADFREALEDRSGASHRLITVMDALTLGAPVQSVRPALRSIVVDGTRAGWQRTRALEAWLNGADSEAGSLRALFDEVSLQPISLDRENLRIHIAAALPAAERTVDIVKSVIADFDRCPPDSLVGRLYRLQRKLRSAPPAALFDEPVSTWLPSASEHHHRVEVEDLFSHVLLAVLLSTTELTAERLRLLVRNASSRAWPSPEREVLAAIGTWLDEKPGRDVELFRALEAEHAGDSGYFAAENEYISMTARRPTDAVIRDVMIRARGSASATETQRLLNVAVSLLMNPEHAEVYWEVYEELSNHPEDRAHLERLTVCEIEDWRFDRAAAHASDREDKVRAREANLAILLPLRSALEAGEELGHLDWSAGRYFEPARGVTKARATLDLLVELTDASVVGSLAAGWERVARTWPTRATVEQMGAADIQRRSVPGEAAALAGLSRILATAAPDQTMSLPLGLALVVFRTSHLARDDGDRALLDQWALERLERDSSEGGVLLARFWAAAFDAGDTHLAGLHAIAQNGRRSQALTVALSALFATRPSMPAQTLRPLLSFAAPRLTRERLRILAEAALADAGVEGPQRPLWTLVAFALDPEDRFQQVLAAYSGQDPAMLYQDGFSESVVEAFAQAYPDAAPFCESLTVRLLGPACLPQDEHGEGRNTAQGNMSSSVRRGIVRLAADQSDRAREFLMELSSEAGLVMWGPSIRHAIAQQTSIRRDHVFRHAAPSAMRDALAGGPPVNASDLRAIVVEELRRLQRELHTGDASPWKRYWNVDSNGSAQTPLVENECRDRLLERLRDRLERYLIIATLPEARRGEETRADMLVLSGAGQNLPIEAKRHFHPAIWTAASTQLQGYAADVGADGFGIYLVFWFGNEAEKTPARPDGSAGPTSAAELEKMLTTDLGATLLARTTVIVLDVADPNPRVIAKPRTKRTPKEL